MSAPSSDSRYSDPSTTSSRTLHSRGSGTYADNGEGSSQRYSRGSRHGTSATEDMQSRGPGSPLAENRIEEQNFARRKQRVRRSGGFLLNSQFSASPRTRHSTHLATAEENGKRTSTLAGDAQDHDHSQRHDLRGQHNHTLHVGKTRDQNRIKQSTPRIETPTPNAPQNSSIDPNQLVHMALNLSESRRRNVAAGALIAPQARAASGKQREGSLGNHGAGGSLKKYLNEQRSVSRNMSPGGNSGSPSRHMSSSMQRSTSLATKPRSSATLARRDKARNYIELRMEYLRLLEFLPPLKSDADAPGNFFVTANNDPGSPQAYLTRVPLHAGKQHDLGRQYNPLQYIRNRRSRARERRTLDHGSHEFADVNQVRDWIDRVEQRAQWPGFRGDVGVSLPKLHGDHSEENAPAQPPRPHKGWIFSPEELLADAYWLEQADNKTIIENRHGRKLFPPREVQKPDLLLPRSSREYTDKRRRSWVDEIAGIAEPAAGDESDVGSDRGRKRRLLPTFRADSPRHGKHSRRGSRLRANLDSDTSDTDEGSRKGRPRIVVDAEHNTGPLALQLETMLRQQTQAQTKSPAIISPDTPDKWGRDHADVPETKTPRDSLDVPRYTNGKGFFKIPPRARTNSTSTSKGDEHEPRSSFDDLDVTAPSTPTFQNRFLHIGSDLTPGTSRGASPTRKSKRSKLNPFHNHENEDFKRSHPAESDSGNADKLRGSRQPSEGTPDSAHFRHAMLGSNAVKSLLSHRKNASTSSLPSPDKLLRKDTDEPQSAVTRFFKGVKHGSKVSEFVFRRDRPDEENADDLSDRHFSDDETDSPNKGTKSKRPAVARSGTASTIDSIVTQKDGRYHLDLPTFRPAHEAIVQEDGTLLSGDHISRQTRERKNDRSPRFDRLAPPKMDLERISSVSSMASFDHPRSHSQERINVSLARSGKVPENNHLPPTTLRKARDFDNRQRSGSRPGLDGKRHWSIADGDRQALRKSNQNLVTQADIARVRALFLCSGVKAKELARHAYTPRVPPPKFLVRAAATANCQLIPVPRKEEHVLAARILMSELDSSTEALNVATRNFRSNTLKELTQRITDLHTKLDDDLMPRILDSGDKAVRISSEISGQGPLQVKQITDEIDRMLRARRRRMRWIRSFGWMMVEWALVALMWWLWLVVVLVGSVRKVFGFAFRIVRWLLWL